MTIAWRMRNALWITTATETHTQNMKNVLLFHIKNGYANAPQYYIYTYIARPVQRSTGYNTASALMLTVLVKKEC
jgi:hypothetical protein